MSPKSPLAHKKRIAIVGAGASGMSAAYALSLHPDLFTVTVFERSASPGGMATSTSIDEEKFGAAYINDGVQGASPVFYNTYAMFDVLGFKPSEVGFQISFGQDPETNFWSNVFPSELIDQFEPDIKRFGKVLKIIKTFEPFFALVSVRAMLSMFMFSKDFGEKIVFPLVALFFGTGNQTPYISCAILERVFLDPNMRLFEYSPKSFLASIPSMRAFPRLSLLYNAWQAEVEARRNVHVILQREVTRVQRSSDSVRIWSRTTKGTDNDQQVKAPGGEEENEFDELVLAVDADAALKVLGSDAGWMERRVLGNVKYLWDVTVTHNDVDYMEKYYRLTYGPSLRSSKRLQEGDKEALDQFAFAEKEFKPLYYVRSYPSDKSKIEMSFDLTNYQPQFKGVSSYGPDAPADPHRASSSSSPSPPPPLSLHVFQTIFLDRDGSSGLWTKDSIDPGKVVLEKWWKQQSHRWQHYAGTVPWMMGINGKNRTHFAGAWTILNMHEIAVVSGFAAAYKLGADFPFKDNKDCKRLFAMYLGASHGARMRKEDREGFFA